MKDLLIQSDHKKLLEIRLENTAFKLISSWPDDKGLSEFDGFPYRQQPAWGQDEDRHLWEVTPGCQPRPLHLHLLHLPILIPLPFPQVKEVLWETCWWGQYLGDDGGERKRRLFYYRCWNKVKLAQGATQKIPHTGLTLLTCTDNRTEITSVWPVFFVCCFRHFWHILGLFCVWCQ